MLGVKALGMMRYPSALKVSSWDGVRPRARFSGEDGDMRNGAMLHRGGVAAARSS